MDALKVLEGLLGHRIACAFVAVAGLNQMDVSVEHYTVGAAIHFTGKNAPTYDILTDSLPSDRRECVTMLLDHMFPKRSVKLEDFPEIANLFNKEETI
jgi:hypothetical protein